MDIVKQDDGSFFCVSNGTPEENEAIDVIGQMLVRLGESDHIAESQANAFGTGPDDGLPSYDKNNTYKNYAYLPYFGEIPTLKD